MENGTVNKRFTWYEQGYYTLQPASGLPAPGAMLTNQVAPDHCYVMAPSYTQNNAALIDLIVDSNSLTPLTPQRFSALSLLTAAGHGPATNLCVISHADGTAQTNAIISPDWFDSAPCAFAAGGRVSVNTKLVDSLNSGFPRLFSVDLSIANRSSEITNILFRFVGGLNDSHAVVFAVSGIAETAPPADGPRLSIHRGENGVISIASTVPGLLQSTATLKGTNTIWRDEGPISGVLTLTRSPFEPTCFYRVLPQ
jgi:hypothetical protein